MVENNEEEPFDNSCQDSGKKFQQEFESYVQNYVDHSSSILDKEEAIVERVNKECIEEFIMDTENVYLCYGNIQNGFIKYELEECINEYCQANGALLLVSKEEEAYLKMTLIFMTCQSFLKVSLYMIK